MAAQTWLHTCEAFDKDVTYGPNPESIARAPSNPEVVYAGIERYGVRRSNDGGRTWRDVSDTLPSGRAHNGVSVAVHPTDPMTAWLGTDGGLFKTTDGGQHWRRLTGGLPRGAVKSGSDVSQTVNMILVDPREPRRLCFGLYATGLNEPAGVWRSDDGGETWRSSSSGIDSGRQISGATTLQRDWIMALTRGESQPASFLAATPFALYLSTDGAATWKKLPRATGAGAVAIDPRDPRHLFAAAADGRVEHSIDGGQTWRDLSAGLRLGREPGATVWDLEFVGPDGKKQKFQAVPGRFRNQVVSFAFDPRDAGTIYACAHAGLYRLTFPTNPSIGEKP